MYASSCRRGINVVLLNWLLACRYADSRCDIGVAINEAFKIYASGGVHVILGPSCDYAAAPVARQVGNFL